MPKNANYLIAGLATALGVVVLLIVATRVTRPKTELAMPSRSDRLGVEGPGDLGASGPAPKRVPEPSTTTQSTSLEQTPASNQAPASPKGPDGHGHFRSVDEYLRDPNFNPASKQLSKESRNGLGELLRQLRVKQVTLQNNRIDVCNEYVKDRIARGEYTVATPGEKSSPNGPNDVRLFVDMDGHTYIMDFDRAMYPNLQKNYDAETELLVTGEDDVISFISQHN